MPRTITLSEWLSGEYELDEDYDIDLTDEEFDIAEDDEFFDYNAIC